MTLASLKLLILCSTGMITLFPMAHIQMFNRRFYLIRRLGRSCAGAAVCEKCAGPTQSAEKASGVG